MRICYDVQTNVIARVSLTYRAKANMKNEKQPSNKILKFQNDDKKTRRNFYLIHGPCELSKELGTD